MSEDRYERPRIAADVVLFGVGIHGLHVLLIERGADPYLGHWALPGGHVDPYESPILAAARELAEETGVDDVELVDLATFGGPGRDPRGWYVSAAHLGVVRMDSVTPRAADDAVAVAWHPLRNLPPLAFDHRAIIERALVELGARRPPTPNVLPATPSGPRILLACGITAAGKSTFCRRLVAANPRLVHLDLDQIRRDVTGDTPTYSHAEAWAAHNAARSIAEWLLRAGHQVIVDVSGLTVSDRAHYLSSGPLFGSPTTIIWCETDEATAIARLEHRAAGLDPLDNSSAKLVFWKKSLDRRQVPTSEEADGFVLVTPTTADTALDEILSLTEAD